MKKRLFKRAGSAVLALAVLAGGTAAVLPMTAPESGIEAQAANKETDFYIDLNSDGTVTITGYKGSSSNVLIPQKIFGSRVTTIKSLNGGQSIINSVSIPDGVTEISYGAFQSFGNLEKVTIPDSVTKIGAEAFKNCISLTYVKLPQKLKTERYEGNFDIESCRNLFEGCTSLESVTIPNGWLSVPSGMFYGCTKLRNVTLSSNTVIILTQSFRDCSNLSSITIPGKVTDIESASFRNCTSLTSVSLPDNVRNIWKTNGGVFQGCTSLKSVRLSKNMDNIRDYAFKDCASLTEIILPEKVTIIGYSAFENCASLKRVIITSNVSSIESNAFNNCDDLTLYAPKNSYTEIFANNKDIPFKAFINASGIALNTSGIALNAKETYQLKATIKPADTTVNTVTWKSSNTKVATVTSSGKVTAVNSGTADITGTTSNGKTAKCSVTVYGSPTSLSLSSSQMSLGLNEATKLTAKVGPQYAKDKSVKWRTSNSKVLKVDQKGNVKAKGKGTAWITARTVNGIEKSCKITVKNAPSSVKLPNAVLTLGVGETYKLGAIIPDGSAAASRTFRTSNSSVVKMTMTNWEGQFKAMKTGTAYVTVRLYNGKEASCKVTVKKAPTSVNLNKTNITMKVGQTGSLSAVISPSDAGCATRTFRTSNSGIVKMTKTNWTGQFKAMKKGVAWVTVRTYNGKEKSCKITVV